MILSRPFAVAITVVMLSIPSASVFAQDATTPAAADANNNDDDGFDLGWLGLPGSARPAQASRS